MKDRLDPHGGGLLEGHRCGLLRFCAIDGCRVLDVTSGSREVACRRTPLR
jgi:hypothetical protein